MGSLLLLDLDNTLADPEAAFWHGRGQGCPVGARRARRGRLLIEHDDDGLGRRSEFFSLLSDHFGLRPSPRRWLEDRRRDQRRYRLRDDGETAPCAAPRDYAVRAGANVVAAVERKTLEDVVKGARRRRADLRAARSRHAVSRRGRLRRTLRRSVQPRSRPARVGASSANRASSPARHHGRNVDDRYANEEQQKDDFDRAEVHDR